MTPHADLVARLLRELVTLVRGECPALLNEDSGGDARLSLAIDDALAALPPPADPPHDCEAWRLEGLGCARCNKADPPALVALGERLRTQDNQMTAHPIFVVEHRNDARRPWEFVTACLTDEGARAYMNANGHNLRKFSRIFVHSGYRNDQWIGLRNHLMALPAAPPVPETLLERAWFCLRCRTQVPVTDVWQESRDGQAEPLYTHHVKDGHVVARIDRWTRVPETPQGWTPEYIKSALAKAYPQQIQVGDVIEFAHGDDPPMFQRLLGLAAVEDWNGKLRNRVRGIYRRIYPKPAAPPQEDQ